MYIICWLLFLAHFDNAQILFFSIQSWDAPSPAPRLARIACVVTMLVCSIPPHSTRHPCFSYITPLSFSICLLLFNDQCIPLSFFFSPLCRLPRLFISPRTVELVRRPAAATEVGRAAGFKGRVTHTFQIVTYIYYTGFGRATVAVAANGHTSYMLCSFVDMSHIWNL